MSFQKHLVEGLAHASKHAREHGEPAKANALVLIGVGVATIWIPIIGIPLIVWGFIKLAKGKVS